MQAPGEIRRVIVVVLDGLRADAIPLFPLPHLRTLARRGVSTLAARTVTPSITAAAMTSLLTGITPRLHGIASDRFGIPTAGPHLVSLPSWLARHGQSTRAYLATPRRPFRGLAERIAARSGVKVRFGGEGAEEILASALDDLYHVREGFFLLHWPDIDQAGHAHGWTSRAYRQTARHVDDTLGRMVALLEPWLDPTTVLIVLSDHGGGGSKRTDHNSLHPLDTTIPVILAGQAVGQGELAPGTSLLDVPATVAWLLTGQAPSPYQGRALIEGFGMAPRLAEAV